MQLGYNTNGFGFHRLEDALAIISALGYRCVALTLDVHHADPFKTRDMEFKQLGATMQGLGLSCVIETGARFLLNPIKKHRPTLLDDQPGPRRDFLNRSMEIAKLVGASCVSYWSGALPPGNTLSRQEMMHRLAHHLRELEQEADDWGVNLALEPEPGFFIESMADYDELCRHVKRRVGLTLDIGHLQCVEDEPPHVFIERYAGVLKNLQLDDMVKGVHKHLPFGEGEVDFPPVFAALKKIGYQGPACIELSDASRNAVEIARRSFAFLKSLLDDQHGDQI